MPDDAAEWVRRSGSVLRPQHGRVTGVRGRPSIRSGGDADRSVVRIRLCRTGAERLRVHPRVRPGPARRGERDRHEVPSSRTRSSRRRSCRHCGGSGHCQLPVPPDSTVSCPIFAYLADSDDVATYEKVEPWSERTRTFGARVFHGHHLSTTTCRNSSVTSKRRSCRSGGIARPCSGLHSRIYTLLLHSASAASANRFVALPVLLPTRSGSVLAHAEHSCPLIASVRSPVGHVGRLTASICDSAGSRRGVPAAIRLPGW